MAIKISNRARYIQPSPTLTVSSKAKKMAEDGIDVVNFGVGEPDFNTPEFIKTAGKNAIDANFTRYTATPGILELRKAICNKLKTDNNLDYSPENILVSAGAKASILHVLMAVCDPKDEVFIPVPYWVSYASQVEMVDAKTVFLPTSEKDNFKLNALQLEDALKHSYNPKALMLNSPNNPTGAVYTKKELEEIMDVCLKYNILLISDEIYEKLIYDDYLHVSPASFGKEAWENTVVINGVSKAYAMTGWRVGYAAGSAKIIQYAARLQEHTTSGICSIAQKAAYAALSESSNDLENMRLEFEKRRNFLVAALNKINNITCNMPKGAFYALPNVAYYILNNKKGITDSDELCLYLLENHHIALVSGASFGIENYVRFSYANSMDNLHKGVERFSAGLSSLLK